MESLLKQEKPEQKRELETSFRRKGLEPTFPVYNTLEAIN